MLGYYLDGYDSAQTDGDLMARSRRQENNVIKGKK